MSEPTRYEKHERIRAVYPLDRKPCAWCNSRKTHHYDCPVPDVHALLSDVAALTAQLAECYRAVEPVAESDGEDWQAAHAVSAVRRLASEVTALRAQLAEAQRERDEARDLANSRPTMQAYRDVLERAEGFRERAIAAQAEATALRGLCKTAVVHRPYAPKRPPRICLECAVAAASTKH